MRRLLPDTIATRTLLVLILGLMVSHLLSMALYFDERASALRLTGGAHTGERIATLAQLVNSASPDERQRIVELADGPKLHVDWSAGSAIEDGPADAWQARVLRDALADHLKNGKLTVFRLSHTEKIAEESWISHLRDGHAPQSAGPMMLASVQLTDGSWLNFAAPIETAEPFWSLRFALSMVVMLAAVIGLSVVVVKRMAEPLATFARAAEELGTNVNAPAIPQQGPAEVRQAIRAFNEMQGRIRRFVEDRTQMLGAIAHDLGTPITRLRLRAEFVEDPEQREKMLADLTEMEKMVFAALSFARDDTANEWRAVVDLKSVVERVCDEATDVGKDVTIDAGADPVPFACQPTALRRALTNLVDNAVKYGQRAAVSLREKDEAVWIEIEDDGPGIPDDLHEEAFRPFRRLEASRSRETGGTGLGLSVARTIIRAHGGDVRLVNRPEGGLRAEIRLPR